MGTERTDDDAQQARQSRPDRVGETKVEVASYRVAGRWTARVHDGESGNLVGRGRGATREEAERVALDGAALMIELQQARSAIRRGMALLPHHREPEDDT